MNYGEKIRIFLVLLSSTIVLSLGIFSTIIISGLFLSPMGKDFSKETINTYNNFLKNDVSVLSDILQDQLIDEYERIEIKKLNFLNYNFGKIKIISSTYRTVEHSEGVIFTNEYIESPFEKNIGNLAIKVAVFIKEIFLNNKEVTCIDLPYIAFNEENIGSQFSCANKNIATLRVYASNDKDHNFIISTVIPIKNFDNNVLGFFQVLSDAHILEMKLGKVLISILSPILISIFLVSIFIYYLQFFLSNKANLNWLNAKNIAHNLKNKTNAIRYYTNKNIESLEDAKLLLSRIVKVLDNLDDFIASTLSEASQEHYGYNKKINNVTNLKDVFKVIEDLYVSDNFVVLGDTDYRVIGDKNKLIDAITAIIDNSIFWNSNKENVEVKLFKNNGYIEINILDNGPGLSEVDIDKIFNKGFSKSKGNGIGLFVAMNIIKAYDGDILPKNRVEGGLCMIVKLRIYNK